AKLAMASLKILKEEKLAENSERLGKLLRAELRKIKAPMLRLVRGKGLFNAIEVNPVNGKDAWDLCLKMAENGLLAKPTHGDKIRFAPPLVITEEQIMECVAIIKKSLESF
ncbi:MAG: aminotransferase class III-fold pyridoxal phosphate-dependent enzyme, partial [Bacteroidia bacterium]|nr:aminotransferase class III-fold pyridoxal phosphate-dependent enzyme [Bacteroidia bacterium]